MACAPSLSSQGGCVAETRSSTFWYLDTTNALVSGRRDTVVTCNPGLTTVTCYDALGVALATCPAAIPVDFAVVTGGSSVAGGQIQIVRTLAPGCAANVPYSQRDTSKYDATTGILASSVIDWINSAGVVSTTMPVGFALGACAASAADVEFTTLCDVSALGVTTEFVRRTVTTFSTLNVPTTVASDLAMDYTSAYVPSGTVGACHQDCDTVTPVGLVAVW